MRPIAPRQLVCLDAVAAAAVFGNSFRLHQQRGRVFDPGDGRRAMATVYLSWILRLADAQAQSAAYEDFLRDLRLLLEHDGESEPDPA